MLFLLSLLVVCFLLMIVFLVIYFYQEKLIFLNDDKLDENYQFNFLDKFEEVFIETADGNAINALHFKLKNPKGVILFCHGNKGNLTKWGERVTYLLKYNYEVFVFDYRNYGKSSGNFKEKEMYNDALLTYDYLKKNYKEENIVMYGFSIGGTFATKIASENKPKELILEAPFYNFKKAATYNFKLAPTFLLKYKFKSDNIIGKVTSPISVFHGNKDNTTSFKQSKKLLDLNTSTKNKFIEIDGGTHHNLREFAIYQQNLKEILER